MTKKVSCRDCIHSRSQDWAEAKGLIEWPSRLYNRWCDLRKYLVRDKPKHCTEFKWKQKSNLLQFIDTEVTQG